MNYLFSQLFYLYIVVKYALPSCQNIQIQDTSTFPCHIKIMPQHKSVGAISILLSYYTTPSQEVCSLIFTLRLRSHLMTYLLYLRLPQVLIYHPEQVNIFQGICLVVFLPVCQAFYDHPMPYTYLPPLPFHHT